MKAAQREALLKTLEARFERNMHRHKSLEWGDVQARLESYPKKLRSLAQMEETGGEPDVVGYDSTRGEYLFYDCSPESPPGRRSLCYDRETYGLRRFCWSVRSPWLMRSIDCPQRPKRLCGATTTAPRNRCCASNPATPSMTCFGTM